MLGGARRRQQRASSSRSSAPRRTVAMALDSEPPISRRGEANSSVVGFSVLRAAHMRTVRNNFSELVRARFHARATRRSSALPDRSARRAPELRSNSAVEAAGALWRRRRSGGPCCSPPGRLVLRRAARPLRLEQRAPAQLTTTAASPRSRRRRRAAPRGLSGIDRAGGLREAARRTTRRRSRDGAERSSTACAATSRRRELRHRRRRVAVWRARCRTARGRRLRAQRGDSDAPRRRSAMCERVALPTAPRRRQRHTPPSPSQPPRRGATSCSLGAAGTTATNVRRSCTLRLLGCNCVPTH